MLLMVSDIYERFDDTVMPVPFAIRSHRGLGAETKSLKCRGKTIAANPKNYFKKSSTWEDALSASLTKCCGC
jgi:hypothetical protein